MEAMALAKICEDVMSDDSDTVIVYSNDGSAIWIWICEHQKSLNGIYEGALYF